MNTPERILVGLAFEGQALTAGSRAALRQGAWLAQGLGAELKLLHSTWDDTHGEPGPSPSDDAIDEAIEIASQHGLESEVEIIDQRPELAMIRRALRGSADMLVVGRHNSGVHELGTVAMKLLRKCPAPVWAVHADAPTPPKRVLVATDLSPAADKASSLALLVTNHARAMLRVVHAWQVPFGLQLDAPGEVGDETLRSIERNALAHVQATCCREDDVNTQIRVVRDTPWRAIVREVDDQESDLVALGTVSRGGIAGFLVGNTAERLLRKLSVSLLAVKPDDFLCPVEA